MRKKSLSLWIMALMLLPVSAMGEDSRLSYENREAGVKLRYPADWIKSETLPGALVAFGVPKAQANLKMVENVTLTVQPLTPTTETLEKYTKMYEAQRKKDPMAPVVMESGKATLGGQPAQRILCVAKQGDQEIEFMQVWTLRNGKAYLFTYGASKETYKNFVSEAEKIIASLVFV